MVPTESSILMWKMLKHANAQLHLYPDSGHGFLYQFADHFAATVNSFLDQHIDLLDGEHDDARGHGRLWQRGSLSIHYCAKQLMKQGTLPWAGMTSTNDLLSCSRHALLDRFHHNGSQISRCGPRSCTAHTTIHRRLVMVNHQLYSSKPSQLREDPLRADGAETVSLAVR